MITADRVPLPQVPWEELDLFADRTIFQTQPWLHFIAETQNAEPVVAVLKKNKVTLGYFTGLIFQKFGVKVLGSPFIGWTTGYMGFNLLPGISRQMVLPAITSFAFNTLKCHFLEIMDRYLEESELIHHTFSKRYFPSFQIDLTKNESELFGLMKNSSCRYCIRKAAKLGVEIIESNDIGFASEYFSQLNDVFAKRGLVPTYKIDRIQKLIKYLLPTSNLLLLNAQSSDGISIATGIFPAFNDTAYFWGGASWRQYQYLSPNEPLIWFAIRYWKAKGMKKFDFGGGGEYKRKYGGQEIRTPILMQAKYPVLFKLKEMAQKLWKTQQKIRGRLQNPSRPPMQ